MRKKLHNLVLLLNFFQRSCLMISWLWNQIKDGGSSGWCRRYSGLSLGSETWDILHGITCLILCYLGCEAKQLRLTDLLGKRSIKADHYLLLMRQPALACFSWNLAEQMSITRIPRKAEKFTKALPFTDSMKKRDLLLDFHHFMNSHKRSRDGKPPLYGLSSFSL